MNFAHHLLRFCLVLLPAALTACAQFPLLGDGASERPAQAPTTAEAQPHADDTPEVHGLAAWAAWIDTAPPQRIQGVVADLRKLNAPSAMEQARLGMLLTRPGHPGFAPRDGLAALNSALAKSKDLARHDIQTVAATADATEAWLSHAAQLRQRAADAEARVLDLEAKIRALAEIENGQ